MAVDRLTELAERWERARAAASSEQPPARQRALFENSLALGQGYARFHRAPVEPQQVPATLAQLRVPCLQGTWSEDPDEAGFWLERPACRAGATAGGCDEWREAIGGLVLGLTGGVRHTRHRSAGHGDPRCLDVVYVDPESRLRYGPIPAELTEGLASVRKLVEQFQGATVSFLGVSEGELLYELAALRGPKGGCGGPSTEPLKQLVERCLLKHFPALKPRELSPRPVMESGGSS